jgi:hypothetical protein
MMKVSLPTVNELEKLPARAVVAYAARTARRVSRVFSGVVADSILDDALRLIDSVCTANRVGEINQARLIEASKRIVDAYVAAPANMKSVERYRLLFSPVQAALAATRAIEAAIDPINARHQMDRTARAAHQAVKPIENLKGETGLALREAARRDYDILLGKYGEHTEVFIGDPINCFDDQETRGP